MNRKERALQILREGTIIPATPLALDENRQFDEEGQRLLMQYYLHCGVGGIATAVHSTQFAIRDPQIGLYEPVLRVVAEEIAAYEAETGRVIVKVAGVCGETGQACREAELTKKYGYDAVLLSPGGLSHLTEEQLLERTAAVAKVMPVIGFYLQTAVGGRLFTPDYWEKLCKIDNVVAIKCAPFNRYQTLDAVRAAATSPRRDEITLYTGNDDNIVADLLANYRFTVNGTVYEKGFDGGLLGHWSVWTKKAVELFETVREAKKNGVVPPELLTMAAAVTDANSAVFDARNHFAGCIAGLHEVLRSQGLMKTIYCLDPEETLSPGQAEDIARIGREYPELCDDAFIAEHLAEWKAKIRK
ncbi:MAG: dihydrodipicolinate synthase family protein [Clostridia bacterium]|nr:dihydrodipicolinate synthase family protein [Clostridia bacterium]